MSHRSRHAAQILWPAFVIAGLLELVVFFWLDPASFRIGSWQPEPMTVYSLVFFVFWALVSLSGLISHWMMQASDQEDGQAVHPGPDLTM